LVKENDDDDFARVKESVSFFCNEMNEDGGKKSGGKKDNAIE
jgi:hypothetical protein